MLNRPFRPARGVTLIELMVGLTILAFLLVSGAPSLADWIRNNQIRSAAESIMTGLHQARAEAVKRNTPVRFQLTSTLGSDCTLSASGQNWVVNLNSGNSPAGKCGVNTSDAADPYLLQKSVAANSAGVSIALSSSSAGAAPVVTFNGLGQQAGTITTYTIDIQNTNGDCRTSTGTGSYRCLRVVVTPAGQARLCDPSITSGSGNKTQAMACPS